MCFPQAHVELRMALSSASRVFWKLGTGDLRTPRSDAAGTGSDPGMAGSRAGSRQRKDSQSLPGALDPVFISFCSYCWPVPPSCSEVSVCPAGQAITPRHSCRPCLCSAPPLQLLCALGAARYNLTGIPKDYFSKHLVIANSSRT